MYDIKPLQWIENYLFELERRRFSTISKIQNWSRFDCPSFEYKYPEPEMDFQNITVPEAYGEENTDTWFKTSFTVPDEKNLYFDMPLQTDSMIFVGDQIRAINPYHNNFSLDFAAGKKISLNMCIYDGHIFPGYHPHEGNRVLVTVSNKQKEYPLIFKGASICQKNEASYNLYYDTLVLTKLAKTFEDNSYEKQYILSSLHKSLKKIDWTTQNNAIWEEEAKKAIKTTTSLLSAKNGTISFQTDSLGSAHLDHAWLWPINETRRKAARTMSTMTAFLEEYPSFKFLFSQPVQSEMVKEDYPEVFKKVKEACRKGQWEPNGCGAVEIDCMLSSGEGIIRNILWGRKLTRELFDGYTGDVFFVPDSFGYMANLPQLLKKSGIKTIVTSKLSWNDTNVFPYDIFQWEGIDGSKINAHMIQGAYEGTNDPVEIVDMVKRIQNKDVQNTLFRTIGEGDGGGGTTRDDLELMKREENLQGMPKNRWISVSDSMSQIFKNQESLPVYKGDLYLEKHRGTFTSQASTKRHNRHLNTVLHDVEYLLSFCSAKKLINECQVNEAEKIINEAWHTLIIYQFHDILPGSSVGIVYEETEKGYKKAISELEGLIRTLAGEKGKLSFNSNPYTINSVAPFSSGVRTENRTRKAEKNMNLNWGKVSFDQYGNISSLKPEGLNLELVKKGSRLGTIKTAEDITLFWDAWDIEKDTLDRDGTARLSFKDGVREGKIGKNSYIKQTINVWEDKGRIDWVTDVDWAEDHQLLSSEFTLSTHFDNVVCDIPFGRVVRPTTQNNSIERACFEFPCHKFVAAEYSNITISVMSNCKYGCHATTDNIGLSLLKSPKSPDGDCDMGHHSFTYSLFITPDGLPEVEKESVSTERPLTDGISLNITPLCTVENAENVVVETVKPAEDRNGLIFRLRETEGIYSSPVSLKFDESLDSSSVVFTNLLEDKIENETMQFSPYEIKTIHLNFS